MKGEGLVLGTVWSVVLWMAAASRAKEVWKWGMSVTGCGAPMDERLSVSLVLNSPQSVCLQLRRGAGLVLSGAMFIFPMIGKWSVLAGRFSGFVSHSTNEGRRLVLQKTLSGREKLPERKVWRVGRPAGRAISISCVSMSSIKGLAASMFTVVKSRVSDGLSQRGWCRMGYPREGGDG